LIKYIEDNNLEQYTDVALNDVPHFDDTQYADDKENDSSQDVVKLDPVPGQPINVTINGSKALLVSKGTSLLAVATEHNINLEKLLTINDLTSDGLLQKDQYVFLEKKQKQGQQDFCVAEPNETLYDISQKYGVVLENLYTYNNLSANDYIVAGTKIYLKPDGPLKQVASADEKPHVIQAKNDVQTDAPENTITYTVHPRESLYGISKKYGVTVDDIKKWNHLKSENLQVGQQLIISK
jgi:LysM repeat protein